MRLVDQIVHHPASIAVQDRAGLTHDLPAAGAHNAAILLCPLRFVLDDSASRHCMELFLSGSDLLALDPRLTRLPAERLWIEWIANPPYSATPGLRVGTLIESGIEGRSGTIRPYYREEDGGPALMLAAIDFDLDAEPACPPGALAVHHGRLGSLGGLMRHMIFRPDPAWAAFARANGNPFQRDLGELAEASWIYLPFVVAFTVLLNTKGALAQRPSQLGRLNAARAKRGRIPLLDHIEVSLNLWAGNGDDRGRNGFARSPARLHQVRGHLVHRHGRIFWRKAHLRGDATRIIATRTVRVTSRRANDRLPAQHGFG
ncbi:MAG TPA: hypothetical protein VGF77_16570 [Allosphingosinicella sp.]